MTIRNLQHLFRPASVAVIGAGRRAGGPDEILVRNLMLGGVQGPVMPVNPDRRTVTGVLAYKDIASLPVAPELAVITLPLGDGPPMIRELGERGTRAVALLNDEVLHLEEGAPGELGQALLDAARPNLLRILGPDGLGSACPAHGVNASLSRTPIRPGHLGVVSESVAVMRAVLDWAASQEIGFSHAISIGARLDVDYSDVLDYLAQDGRTKAILMYLEQVRKPRKFLSAARIAARLKPVIVLKPRLYGAGRVADAVYDAAFRRAGILRVSTIEQLFNSVEALATIKPVASARLAIVGNSRSIGSIASDALTEAGGTLAGLAGDTVEALRALVPAGLPTDNPVDLGMGCAPEAYGEALARVDQDPGVDGVLVVHAPRRSAYNLSCARAVVERAGASRRALLACWLGAGSVREARALFRDHKVPSFSSPETAVQAFVRLAEYRRNQELLMQTPPSVPREFEIDREAARAVIAAALAAGRRRLNAYETARVLSAYQVPVIETRFAEDPERAAGAAASLGVPVALKIMSPEVAHKSDVGGLALDLAAPQAVAESARAMLARVAELVPGAHIDGFVVQPMRPKGLAYELDVGIRDGGGFGPVIVFGHGGTESEVIDDLAYALPPLNMALARELAARTRLYAQLASGRHRGVDLEAISLALIKVAQMAIELAEIVRLDINPLWAGGDGVIALDAAIDIAEPAASGAERLAIRPYPKELEEPLELAGGRELLIRPIVPEDEPRLQDMVKRAPAEDLRLRFFQPLKELSHAMAARLTQLDYDREMAFAAADRGRPGEAELWGVVRLTADPDLDRAEYAIIVDRQMSGRGLGPMLMARLIDYARGRGIREVYGEVLRENKAMLKLNRTLGFTVKADPDDPGIMKVTLSL